MRRRRRRGGVCWKWLGHPPRKNKFCSQNDKLECILTQFLTGTKHGQSEQLEHGFYGSVAKQMHLQLNR